MILVNKPTPLTPLQAIDKLRKMKPALKDEVIGYAGRLDPMAKGLLLLLVGDENKKRKEYERLDKTYEFEVLLGIETDSYDILGLVEKCKVQNLEIRNSALEIPRLLESFEGRRDQSYPPYSAARVQGKPLYYWAREGKLDEVEIPSKTITIHSLELNDVQSIKLKDLRGEIQARIKGVQGEFRQDDILAC